MSQVEVLEDQLGELELFLRELANLAYWGPRWIDGEGQAPDVPGFDHANASLRLGLILGALLARRVQPAPDLQDLKRLRRTREGWPT
jgi:hypothetical protein